MYHLDRLTSRTVYGNNDLRKLESLHEQNQIGKKITTFTEDGFLHRWCPISWKTSMVWNGDLGWSINVIYHVASATAAFTAW